MKKIWKYVLYQIAKRKKNFLLSLASLTIALVTALF